MQVERFDIEGILLLKPRVFADARGAFMETWNERSFKDLVGDHHFVQDNESTSHKGVLRGLHFQAEPHAQGKLVRALNGSVLDICVDIRPASPTFGRHVRVELSSGDGKLLWIPPGFAHGFVALEDRTVFAYKCTALYHPASERTILWNDKDLGIDWGITDPIVSDKDRQGFAFAGNWTTKAS
ncbi:MAG TPA: dTDP-4-dehydrorhamnose 3,5-epimerase [Flavobacteriales bacterium]|nr:dTDP-4-dehydrorhamnose 3,5-epimerase [Flavobacteriales bacterium]